MLRGEEHPDKARTNNKLFDMMNNVFSFDADGVQRWQDELTQAGAGAIASERWSIEDDFMTWLTARFTLTPEQIAYANDLGTYAHDTYAVMISNALASDTTISLLIETTGHAPAGRPYTNPKVIEIRDRIQRRSAPMSISEQHFERSLLVHIYYEDGSA